MSKELLSNDQKIEIMGLAFTIKRDEKPQEDDNKAIINFYKAMVKAIQEDEPEITGTTVTFTDKP